jgi:hypothetical protein
MTQTHRLILAALIGLFTAAAVGRAGFGADTEAMVLRAPAFWAALPAAMAAGYLGARAFGRFDPSGLIRSAAVSLVALVLALLTAGALVGDVSRLVRWIAQPMGWGAVLAGWGAAQLAAWRQGQSRK